MSILHYFGIYPTFPSKLPNWLSSMIQKKVIYKTILTLPKQPGIIRFTLHKNLPEQRINTTYYYWYLTLISD
jgi:hypothetical protein